jgi:hypothetical protein
VPQREGGLRLQRRHAARSHSVHIARPRTARDAQAKLRRDVRFGRRVRDSGAHMRAHASPQRLGTPQVARACRRLRLGGGGAGGGCGCSTFKRYHLPS